MRVAFGLRPGARKENTLCGLGRTSNTGAAQKRRNPFSSSVGVLLASDFVARSSRSCGYAPAVRRTSSSRQKPKNLPARPCPILQTRPRAFSIKIDAIFSSGGPAPVGNCPTHPTSSTWVAATCCPGRHRRQEARPDPATDRFLFRLEVSRRNPDNKLSGPPGMNASI